MNKNKFAFIICTNNEVYLYECCHYLQHLVIPDGYEIEIITKMSAESMASGYNQIMSVCDAKYKIYMHQDVFVVNRYFLYDVLEIFKSDTSIGMIGYDKVSSTGVMWYEQSKGLKYLYGANQKYSKADYSSYRFYMEDGIEDVALIDGFMMITAYDLIWDEEALTGWDFYDAFQSMNFLLHGYRVVVPVQTLPWVIHDSGKYLSMWDYDKYRKLFIEIYQEYLGKSAFEIRGRQER